MLDLEPAGVSAADGSMVRGHGRLRRALDSSQVSSGIAVLAGGLAGIANDGATGRESVLSVVLVLLLTAAAGRSGLAPLILASAAAAICGESTGTWLAFAALGVVVACAALGVEIRAVRAIAGACLGHALLRLGWPTDPGATAAVAAAAAVVVLVPVWWRMGRPGRRIVGLLVVATVALVVLCVAGFGVAVLNHRDGLTTAVADAEVALDAARTGDTEAAAVAFDRAGDALAAAAADLDAWWARPVHLLPGLSQQAAATEALVDAAAELVTVGSSVAKQADYDRVRPRRGRIDLDAVAALDAPLEATLDALESARTRMATVRSEWLVGPLAARVDRLVAETRGATEDTTSALAAVRTAPLVLGGDRPTRWFMAVVTPAELRGLGGLLGSWGILTADDGQLELPVIERAEQLMDRGPFSITVSPDFERRNLDLWQLARFPQNVTSSPDLPGVAEAIRDTAEQAGYGPIDGVIVVDPLALAAMLELTGPVDVDWLNEPLTASNAAQVLLVDQYEQVGDPGRIDFLEDVTRKVFDRIRAGELPEPDAIGQALGPMLHQKHLRLYSFDPRVESFFGTLGPSGRLEIPVADAIGVVTFDRTPSKLNAYLKRSVDYDVTVDSATGAASAIARVTYENGAPADLPLNGYLGDPPGTSELVGTLYSALRMDWADLDGKSWGFDIFTERGHHVYDADFEVPAGGRATLSYGLSGVVPLLDGRYRLDVHRQPTVHPDQLRVRVNGRVVYDGLQNRDVVIEVDL